MTDTDITYTTRASEDFSGYLATPMTDAQAPGITTIGLLNASNGSCAVPRPVTCCNVRLKRQTCRAKLGGTLLASWL